MSAIWSAHYRIAELPAVQHTVACFTCRLGEVADEHGSMERLAEELLLPPALKELKEGTSQYVTIEWILRSGIPQTLQEGGLVQYKSKQVEGVSEIETVSKTELFDGCVAGQWYRAR